MRFPFGLTEKRFKWQTDKSSLENVEINGTMKRYKEENNQHQSTLGNWSLLLDKSEIEKPRCSSLTTRSSKIKFIENMKSIRTILPEKDTTFEDYLKSQKKILNLKEKKDAGGIIKLIDKTPLVFDNKHKKIINHLNTSKYNETINNSNKSKNKNNSYYDDERAGNVKHKQTSDFCDKPIT